MWWIRHRAVFSHARSATFTSYVPTLVVSRLRYAAFCRKLREPDSHAKVNIKPSEWFPVQAGDYDGMRSNFRLRVLSKLLSMPASQDRPSHDIDEWWKW